MQRNIYSFYKAVVKWNIYIAKRKTSFPFKLRINALFDYLCCP